MPQLTALIGQEEHRLSFEPGPSLREILEEAGYQVRTACRGHGACGLCEVRLIAGETAEPDLSERLHITPERLAQGVRLACQLRPEGDLELEVLHPAPPAKWQRLSCEDFPPSRWQLTRPRQGIIPGINGPQGVAVDLGTTNIRLALFKQEDGQCLGLRRGRNPQANFGADLLTRLAASQESTELPRALSGLAASGIGEGLSDLARREGIDLRRVTSLALVGNTAMLALLAGKNHHLLLEPRNWQSPIDCHSRAVDHWVETWGLHPQASLTLFQPLAGFVGSDLLAGLVATRLIDGPAPALFIDFGTNSEIAWWDGVNLWVTSAAGGPAFELWGMSHGMPAEPGAVNRVIREPDGSLCYQVIGGEDPQGFCGSGLVDLIARLLEIGQLTRTGRFSKGPGPRWTVAPGTAPLDLSLEDVDNLQRAKGAIGTGMQILARHSGGKLSKLQRVCVAGEFGHFLDVASAQFIGLLPMVPKDRVELICDAALRGCSDLLLSAAAAEQLSGIRTSAKLINLALAPDFEELFLANLYLEPLKEE
ncbi:MAG: ASKHA domain-containing protein [Deltaproteobacteria bacterium]|nr:ASKHA domain-containing protein [Deltaproteobacteria bacterium]